MNKRKLIVYLAAITVVGSLMTALASNMLMGDVLNKGLSFTEGTLFASLPSTSIALLFVLGIFYFLRTYKHPDCKKKISHLYLILAAIFGVIGTVSAILAGVNIYHTFVGSHPFPGYVLIFMILNILVACSSICGLIFLKKMPNDEGRVKIKASYVFKTIGWFLFICLMFNRFGMFLASPLYIYWSNFNETFLFYIYLLLPLFLGIIEALYILGIVKGKKMLVLTTIGLAANVCLFTYSVIMGLNDTGFISALSQVMPLERMASLPLEIIIHFLAYLGTCIALFVQYKKSKKEE